MASVETVALLIAAAPDLLEALLTWRDVDKLEIAVQRNDWVAAARITDRHIEIQGDLDPGIAIRILKDKALDLRKSAIAKAIGLQS